METQWGAFCEIFGVTPRNRIIEFFLEMRELDFAIGDVAKEIGLNRATTYSAMDELVQEGYLIPTRKVSGGQLYIMNEKKREVQVLKEAFANVLKRIQHEEERKRKDMVYVHDS